MSLNLEDVEDDIADIVRGEHGPLQRYQPIITGLGRGKITTRGKDNIV